MFTLDQIFHHGRLNNNGINEGWIMRFLCIIYKFYYYEIIHKFFLKRFFMGLLLIGYKNNV